MIASSSGGDGEHEPAGSRAAHGEGDAATACAGEPTADIDPRLVHEVAAQVRHPDAELTIARPPDYVAIEEASRGADAGDVLTPLTVDLLEWFIDRNPFGKGFVVTARDRGTGELVGHFVFHRWAVKLRRPAGATVEVPACIHVRLWVATRLRRRGVFLSMTEFGLELLRRTGVGIAYTVPMNERSAPGFLKIGEQRAGYLPLWVRPRLPGWPALVGGLRERGLEVERREAFDRRFDDACDTTMPDAAAAWSPRRAALLNWRYTERPDFDYELRYIHRGGQPVGYLVTRRMRIKGLRTLVVCDSWSKPEEAAALRLGIDDALDSGDRADLVVAFGGNVRGTVQRGFRRAGLVRWPRLLQPPVSIVGRGIGEDEQRVELPPIDGWYVTPYDWDVF